MQHDSVSTHFRADETSGRHKVRLREQGDELPRNRVGWRNITVGREILVRIVDGEQAGVERRLEVAPEVFARMNRLLADLDSRNRPGVRDGAS